jgi:coenzyme F420-dependent glucose-6-phosphate dehydrogenase
LKKVFPILVGYHAEAEGHQPSELLNLALEAHRSGFDFIAISDHFHPWFHTHAASCFAWSWISAAAATVPKVKLGPLVSAAIGRYNPALIAQSFATMDEMYPGRFFLGLGTGEAMNEIPVGIPWPKFGERLQRLKETVEIIRALWTKEFVDYQGQYYSLKGANLYTKPRTKIPIYIPASGPKSAALVGSHADGYATVDHLLPRFNEIWRAIESSAKKAGRDPLAITKNVELFVSYDKDYSKALSSTRKWKPVLIPHVINQPIYDPRQLESYGSKIDDSEIEKTWAIVTSAEQLIKKVESVISIGFNEVQFHSSSPSEEEFMRVCSKEVLPYLKSTYGKTIP